MQLEVMYTASMCIYFSLKKREGETGGILETIKDQGYSNG